MINSKLDELIDETDIEMRLSGVAGLESKFLEDEISSLSQLAPNVLREAPFRWICAVFVDHGKLVLPVPAQKLSVDPHKDLIGPWVGGTGLLISPRHVLTCGHIFTDRLNAGHKPKKDVVSFVTTKQSELDKEPVLGPWPAEGSWCHPKVLEPSEWVSRSFDFGLIQLSSKGGEFPGDMMIDMKNKGRERFGWWGQSRPNYFMNTHRPAEWLRWRKVNVYGFPEASNRNLRKLHHGFGDVSAVYDLDKSKGRLHPMIRYDVRTVVGSSGGPVWTVDRNPLERRLVGVHGGSRNGGSRNGRGHCLLMNPVIAAFLREHGVKNRMLEAADVRYGARI